MLVNCHICLGELKPHPLYDESVAKLCIHHGDFFILRLRGKEPEIVFRSLKEYDKNLKNVVKVKQPPRKRRLIAVAQTRPGNSGIIVRCNQTGEVFARLKDAAAKLGVSNHRISTHLSGKQAHVNGYTFTIMDDLTPDPNFILQPIHPGRRGNPPIKIRCEQTGEIFESMRLAAKTFNLNWGGIYRHLTNRTKYPQVKGYSFSKLD